MEIVKIGNNGKLSYDRVGMMKLIYQFVIDSDRISTIFLYDLIQTQIVNASSVSHDLKEIVYEIEPNDHTAFELSCNRNECILRLFNIEVKKELRYYNSYDQEETTDVSVKEIYNIKFGRNRFRTYTVDEDAPDIFKFILTYLIPIDLPYSSFGYTDADEIVEKMKKFFWS